MDLGAKRLVDDVERMRPHEKSIPSVVHNELIMAALVSHRWDDAIQLVQLNVQHCPSSSLGNKGGESGVAGESGMKLRYQIGAIYPETYGFLCRYGVHLEDWDRVQTILRHCVASRRAKASTSHFVGFLLELVDGSGDNWLYASKAKRWLVELSSAGVRVSQPHLHEVMCALAVFEDQHSPSDNVNHHIDNSVGDGLRCVLELFCLMQHNPTATATAPTKESQHQQTDSSLLSSQALRKVVEGWSFWVPTGETYLIALCGALKRRQWSVMGQSIVLYHPVLPIHYYYNFNALVM
jgi:hypothetical protein